MAVKWNTVFGYNKVMMQIDDNDDLFYEDRYLKIKEMVSSPLVSSESSIKEIKAAI